LFRGINAFKRGYQPRSNLVKDENGDLFADSHNILNNKLRGLSPQANYTDRGGRTTSLSYWMYIVSVIL
jgi:hypothetical protein